MAAATPKPPRRKTPTLKTKLQRNVKPAPTARTADTFRTADADTHRTSVDLPAGLRRRLRRAAVDADTTMTDLIAAAITTYLGQLADSGTVRRPRSADTDTRRTTLRLPIELRRRLRYAAIDHDATMADLILAAITDHLKTTPTTPRPSRKRAKT
jgi:predicted DNA-binding protein